MLRLKRYFKKNSHHPLFKPLAGFGRALNRLYENRNHDCYSNGELTVLEKLAGLKPKVIIDGGANVGNYTKLVSAVMPECMIYAFEPVKSTFEQFEENTKGLSPITAINKGLYKENCKKSIHLYASSEHSSLYALDSLSYQHQKKIEIDLISGDDFMKEYQIEKIDLLKLDLEGAEFDALLGFQNNIKRGKIRLIQFEYGYLNISTRKLLIDFYTFFNANGYLIGKIFPKYVEFRAYEIKYEDFLGPNFIAVHQSDQELIKLLGK